VTWWGWTLLWVVLVLGAAGIIYLAVRRLLRQGMALARELGAAADALAEVTRALEELDGRAEHVQPAEHPRHSRSSTRRTRGRPRRGSGRQDVR
jgi:hypothetical protein